MIKIPLTQEDIAWAKEETAKFDAQKTYNKLECKNNFLGILGERMLNKWFEENKAGHEWIDFVKKGWEDPDFKIDGKTIDIKTTFDNQMWFQKVVFDYYVFARCNEDLKELFLIGWIEGKKLQRLLDNGTLDMVKRGDRIDFVCPISKMKGFECFLYYIYGKDTSKLPREVQL